MKKSISGQWVVVLSLLSASVWWASVSIREAAAKSKDGDAAAPSKDPVVIEAVRKVERDMGDAVVAVDIDRLDQIFADDWATIGRSGRIITKEKVLQDFKAGKDKLVSYESRDRKDASGESVWMDLLEKRAGNWVVVRSASASVR